MYYRNVETLLTTVFVVLLFFVNSVSAVNLKDSFSNEREIHLPESTTRLRLVVLNPIKHSCTFFKHSLKI